MVVTEMKLTTTTTENGTQTYTSSVAFGKEISKVFNTGFETISSTTAVDAVNEDSAKTLTQTIPQEKRNKEIQVGISQLVTSINGETKHHNEETTIREELPECLQNLLEGLYLPGDCRYAIDSEPDWLDMDKFKKGQEFALKHWASLCFGNMLLLFLGINFPRLSEPLIFTDRSSTPFKAFKRYKSTVIRTYTWYSGNIWDPNDPAHKDIKEVRLIHNTVMKRMNAMSPQEIKDKVTLDGKGQNFQKIFSSSEAFQEFKKLCPVPISDEYPHNVLSASSVGSMFVTQFDMALTQIAFIEALVMYPEKFGVHDATEEELEGFIHFWRGVGYLLGIDDRFNICNDDSLESTRHILHNVSKYWMWPSIRKASLDAEYMGRCIVEGTRYYVPTLHYHTALMYLCFVYDIDVFNSEKFLEATAWYERFMFSFFRFVLVYIIRVPGVRPFLNWLVNKLLDQAYNMSPPELDNEVIPSYYIIPNLLCFKF